MATYNANKHGIRYGVTGSMANKLASLTDDGPLMVHKENWLAVVGEKFLPPAGTNNLVPISYYIYRRHFERDLDQDPRAPPTLDGRHDYR